MDSGKAGNLYGVQRNTDKRCLKQLYQKTGYSYFSGLEVDERVSYSLKKDFLDTGWYYFDRLSSKLSDRADEIIYDNHYNEYAAIEKMLISASDVATKQIKQLPRIIQQYDKRFGTYIDLQREKTDACVYVSELGTNTCDSCRALHGKIFSVSEIPSPPRHPNCQCSIVSLDKAASLMYNIARRQFMLALESGLENNCGGLWRMDLSYGDGNVRVGRIQFELLRITGTDEPSITDSSGKIPAILDIVDWAKDFGEEAIEYLQQFWDSAKQRSEQRFNDFWSFWDWISSGIVSGVWTSAATRAELARSDPSLYNILNWILLGMPELAKRALDPEDPLSFDHCMANLELVTVLFGIYSVYQRRVAAMDDPVLEDPGMPHIDPEFDEEMEERPTWRQSEIDIGEDYPDYEAQKSFKNGKEVPYATKGSVRPDYYKDGHSVEVKNYDLSTEANCKNVVRNIVRQYKQRLTELPEGTKQTVIIDIRGQRVPYTTIRSIKEQIATLTNSGIEIKLKR